MKRKFCSLVLFVVAFSASADISGRIVRVLDGDTVEMLEPGNQLTRIRLAGIDAPEKSQPFGQRSRQELSSMVTQRHVTVTGSDTDRYGRLLGTVWLGVTDVNAEQIRKGLAWAYRYHGKPVRPDYAVLEAEARRQSVGLWSEPGQTEPWRWRSLHQEELKTNKN
ncbi:TPA: thermonuclease family protein [Enterobacter hormaechei subsp. hoffmannii]|jgi:endonuclease YncB( thermonuclease family)|uniref:Plasmid stablization protein ParB n=1 Tax=Enterobacter chengduensis TaxID=2494701 RepID=A0AAW3HAQ9_9ENTR|nr:MULTISPECIES: thermonuclease family protein [Enterobacter cloacae complex]EFO2117973.1 chromosome partitioning protein ParB [Escherichia coli O3]EIH9910687.1 thermonuclease family protein [Escherichia coli]ELY4503574.1 thermonuclease family protein [Cronobacter sakazakii]HDS8122415.1 thermonuclease family protein [Enterobacter hormaechei subsp. steigerwaltii]ELY4536645.1 thermonuclease family protein [Cronobacter sakazakii]